MMLQKLWLITILLIVYPYIVYPPLMLFMANAKKYFNTKLDRPIGTANPMLSIVVAAYNEEAAIEAKMRNLLSLNYPSNKYEVLIGSDGSTDSTNRILKEYSSEPNVRVFYFSRRGKSVVLDALLQEAKGEILIFSDAAEILAQNALQKIVRPFDNPAIGAVAGNRVCGNEGLYQRLGRSLRLCESEFGVVIGADGPLYAVRAQLVPQSIKGIISDDFIISMNPLFDSFKVVFEPDALVYDEEELDTQQSFSRYVRVSAGHYQALKHLWPLLHPKYGLTAFAFLSHRVLRWCGPFFMLVNILLAILLVSASTFHMVVVVCQVAAILLAALYYYTNGRIAVCAIWANHCLFFLLMNIAMGVGSLKYVLGQQTASWDTNRG